MSSGDTDTACFAGSDTVPVGLIQAEERLHDIWLRACRNDHLAILELRKWLFPLIESTCSRVLAGGTDREDIAEEVFQDFVYRHLGGIERLSSMPSYVRMMAVRRCVRQRAVARRYVEIETEPVDDSAETQLTERLDHERLQAALAACLRQLDPRTAAIMRERYFLGQTLEQIGASHNLSKQHVGRIIDRTLARIKRCLERRR